MPFGSARQIGVGHPALFGQYYTEHAIGSMVALPLVVADQAVGMLALYTKEINFFGTEELALLTELADDIALAIDHIAKEQRLHYLAYHDERTGLANRSLFLERVAQYLCSATGAGHKVALYLIDIERLKNINDSLGRPAGDVLLQLVAQWLTHETGDAKLLARLPVDALKIDRSFVQGMTTGPQGLALVSTVINLAHALSLKVIAEGVETDEQSRLLQLLGCDEIQGYLVSRPLPSHALEARFLGLAPAAPAGQ